MADATGRSRPDTITKPKSIPGYKPAGNSQSDYANAITYTNGKGDYTDTHCKRTADGNPVSECLSFTDTNTDPHGESSANGKPRPDCGGW